MLFMKTSYKRNQTPNEQISSSIVHAMSGEQVLSAIRMATGDQNFLYAVKTSAAEYVLRMTDISHKHKFGAYSKNSCV
jgi:hypothetical protein